MAKKWIKKATANAHGQFRGKAEKAGAAKRDDAPGNGKRAKLYDRSKKD